MPDPQFLLKTAPPRPARSALVRARLERRWEDVCDRTAILVTAPQGFGKTTLLAQWRRRWLERGACVAWIALDAQDDRARFVEVLLHALRAATGRDSLATAASSASMESQRELDALTALLAEIALLATQTVVILDDAHRMPQEVLRDAMAYLLNNAPSNLQFVLGSRRPLDLSLADLMAAGRTAEIQAAELRLSMDETLAVLRARFGQRVTLDDAARLHEITEGWPLGLQLAATTIERAPDLHEVISQLSARRGDLQRYFFETLLARLPAAQAGVLVRCAILETLNADLCAAITGDPDAGRYLGQLTEDLALVSHGEQGDWVRLHALARDFLLGQFDQLDISERRRCYARAAAWYAERGELREAARHAFAAGDEALAVDFAARCLLDIAREGRWAETREWVRRLPASVLDRDVHLQIVVAWTTALSDDSTAVPALIERIEHHPQYDESCRFPVAIVKAAFAIFTDRSGDLAEALREWEQPPPGASPLHVASLANSLALLALRRGEPARARTLVAPHLAGPREPSMRLVLTFGDLIVGLSWMLEGNAREAVRVLQPRLDAQESDFGRRSLVAAMLAGPLAAGLVLLDRDAEAEAMLADRLDVIERVGMPDAIVLAYRALAAIASRRGDEARSLQALAALHQLAQARDLPRVALVALAEQLRLHVLYDRVDTAATLLQQVDALEPVFRQAAHAATLHVFVTTRALCAGFVLFARRNYAEAEKEFREAAAVPAALRAGLHALTARAMQALASYHRGRSDAVATYAEVMGLAELQGTRGFIERQHPGFALLTTGATPAKPRPARSTAASIEDLRSAPAVAGGLLTPKEAHILQLLTEGKANKEIARALDIGEQTVKWHLKNLFFKLNAAGRKHAVDRARLLGLLAS